MYQYEGRNKNIERRNRDIVDLFNTFPRKCPNTGLRYDTRSVYELVAERFYLSVPQVERILSGKATPKKKKPAPKKELACMPSLF